ncbi:MAG: cysteine desulfurase family protein [Myxococcota bacterium]
MIYLDHHAATPLMPEVREAMDRAATKGWANPSSTHAAGRAAKRYLEHARDQVAAAVASSPSDVVLTGGGTEACNLGVRGLAEGRRRIITTAIEHPAVERSVNRLAEAGAEVVVLPVSAGIPPTPGALDALIEDDSLVAIQWVNHETGTVFPVAAYAEVCRARGARLFVDATQALGKVPVEVERLGADAVAFAAQKIGGPPGAGACWVRRGIDLTPVLDGGSQERGRWPGTPDTVAMVGFGQAAALADARLSGQEALGALRDRIETELLGLGAVRNGSGPRVATVANLSFEGWEGAVLVAALDVEGVCASTGAACSSGLQEPSAVLRAMYPDEQWRAGSAVRISLGIETTEAEIIRAGTAFEAVLARAGSANLKRIRAPGN